MFTDVQVRGFRTFADFTLHDLTRVNLLVGQNNCGKTAALEALELLCARSPFALMASVERRGETLYTHRKGRPRESLDPTHLFHGRALEIGSEFLIAGSGTVPGAFRCTVASDNGQSDLFEEADTELFHDLSFEIAVGGSDESAIIPVSDFTDRVGRRPTLRRSNSREQLRGPAQFVDPRGPRDPRRLWDSVVLTEQESLVVETLRIIEPDIERVAHVGLRDAFVLRLRDQNRRIPLGSMGDGMKYLLWLSLSLSNARHGVLLVDEIDTGLHYTVLEDMWRLVFEASHSLDVQVFASTHSADCVAALARVVEAGEHLREHASVHRIERGDRESIRYSATELAAATRHEMEIR